MSVQELRAPRHGAVLCDAQETEGTSTGLGKILGGGARADSHAGPGRENVVRRI
jgi:hypothetical protein